MSELIGKKILHYRIASKLGEGGMGVVYKAEDTKLKRDVAIKFLPRQIAASEEERARFKIEAQAAAALNHPNIATIYAIEEHDDEMFIVMEYIEGRELRDVIADKSPEFLKLRGLLDIASQIASGLQAAHEKGVNHRDIKSANIMITEKDQVKIMDFGLAKIRGNAQLTKVGTTLGTAAYMSPEQARGEETDERADIWSFGVVLYEMLTGKMPFPGDYEQAVMYSIMNEDPEPVSESRDDMSEGLENIANKCLQKETKNRYQNTEDLQADLKTLTGFETLSGLKTSARSPRQKRTFLYGGIVALVLFTLAGYFFFALQPEATAERVPIAVVDFVNQTNEPELDGLSGMLITALEQSRRLSVLSRARMYDEFKQMNQPNLTFVDETTGREISKRANISALAVATIRKFGQLYTIDFKVIDPQSGDRLFSTKVEGKGQESIPGLIDQLSAKTRIDLKEQEHVVRLASGGVAAVTTTNLKAYQHYFQGEQLINQLQFRKAQKEFKQAVALDSTFALALYRLAYALEWTGASGDEAAIQKAMQYVDTVPEKEQYMIRALFVRIAGESARAITLYKDVLKLYPEEKEAIYLIGDYSYHQGDYSTAITYLEKVLGMDPLFERAWQHLLWTHRDSEQYERQLTAARQYKENISSGSAYEGLAQAFVNNQDYRSAVQTYRAGEQRFPDATTLTIGIGYVYFLQENYRQATIEFRKFLEAERPAWHKGMWYKTLIMLNGHLGRYQEVLRFCDRLIEFDAKSKYSAELPHAYALKAFWLAYGLHDIEGARQAIQKGLTYQDDATNIFYNSLFFTYARIGEYEKATDLAAKHLTGATVKGRVVNGYKQKAAGKLEAAISDFKFTSEKGGIQIRTICSYNLALCYFEGGQNELAIQAAQRTMKIAPSIGLEIYQYSMRAAVYARTFHLLGKIYEKRGDKQRAIENTAKFLEIWKDADPDLPDLIEAKARLARLQGVSEK